MTKSYVNFDEVKMRVGMEELLTHYGLLDRRTKRKGDELTMHCVFHDNDTTPSLKINTAKNRDYSIFTGFWYGSRGAFVV